ncbi:M48 family metalloprotease [Crocinitomicaceae bacterium]|nr:M48 family metalloprotease [Crocinitomicaceae bacterium]
MRHLLSALIALVVLNSSAQVDFNNYTTLLSSGSVPEDFTLRTYEKLEEDMEENFTDMSQGEKMKFYTNTNYMVDALMHSGSIIYGDPITEYVQEVAKKLMVKDKKLFRELRFYTIKSNATNAFSTEQGIVFVTTGLLSQITSEAQLAYVLAHEIAHYQKEHVLESYSYQRENRSASIEQMSVHSKDNELEADELGLEMYARAGYSKDEIKPTFDVLLYSYLPFDEVQVPNEYFQAFDTLFVPSHLFPSEPYEIEAVEDEDDSRSSHPNIKTRKNRIDKEIDKIKNWKTDVYKLGEDRFKEVRQIARFEVVRINVHEAEYADALYTIFLLERDYPESMFLQRMKAQCWQGILQYRIDNSIFSVVDRKSELEGASANVHHFIKEMSKSQLITMCVRQVATTHQKNSEDKEISAIYDKMIWTVANTDRFELEDYANVCLRTAYVNSLPSVEESDTTSTNKTEELNKYDRIKGKKSGEDSATPDSSDFHIYLIPDLMNDQAFLDKYEAYSDEFKKQEEEEEAYSRMTAKERYYYDQKKKREGNLKANEDVDYLISMEPIVLKYGITGIKFVKSEKTQESVHESIDIAARKSGIQVSHLDRTTIAKEGTQSYNDRCILMNYLEQSANNTDVTTFPVDYQLVNDVQDKFGTPYVMYSVASHGYAPDFATMGTLYSFLFFPSIPVYFPIKLFMGNQAEINMIVMSLETGKIVGVLSHEFRSTLRKHVFGAHIYSLFDSLKTN